MWAVASNPRIKSYPAPAATPTDTICRRLHIPNDPRIIAAVNDVLAYLTLPEVWEAADEAGEIDMRALMTEMWHQFTESDCA